MKLPIDTSSITFLAVAPPEPVLDFETRQPRADDNGEALYSVQLVALAEDSAEIIGVKVAGKPGDAVKQGTSVKVSGLVASPWSMGDRSGVAFRAQSIEPATARSSS